MGEPVFAAVFDAVVKTILARIKTLAIAAGVLLAVFVAIALFSHHPLAMFLKLLSFAGIAAMVVSVAVMLLTFHQAREVVPAALIASLAVALLGTLVTLLFTSGRPTAVVTLLSLAAGGALGVAWAHTSVFFVDRGRIRMKGSVWSLAVWVLTLALNQAVVLVFGHAPEIVLCLMLAGAGVAAGNTAGLVWRARKAAAFVAEDVGHA